MADINTPNADDLKAYLDGVKVDLGNVWLNDAEDVKVVSYKSLGAVAFEYATSCYINDVTVEDCANKLREKF